MIYKIDGCEELKKEILIKKTLIEMYKVKVERLNGRLNDALAYGFRKNQEFNLLLKSHKQLENILEGVRKDEKNWLHDNK